MTEKIQLSSKKWAHYSTVELIVAEWYAWEPCINPRSFTVIKRVALGLTVEYVYTSLFPVKQQDMAATKLRLCSTSPWWILCGEF